MAIGTSPVTINCPTATATVIHRDQLTELHVPYNRAFLANLKTSIPFTFRQYNPVKQVWTILHPYRSHSERIVLTHFPAATVQGVPASAGKEAAFQEAKKQAERKNAERAAEREAARKRREARDREKHEQARRDEAERLRRKAEQEANDPPRQQRQEPPRQHTSHRPTSADHELLGVSLNVTLPVLEAAYRALSKQHHPDRGGNPETMKAINLAYARIKRTLR